jgi:putative aldouronate transport system substrate-binding protein
MVPLWGTPPRPGNPFWTAMDEAIGGDMRWQIQDGSTYGDKLSATLAGSKIPDLVCVPGWELRQGQIAQAVSSRFADLGPYLGGDKALDYPNLAAIPTRAWQSSVFDGALRGLPMPASELDVVLPYYRQDIFEANGWTPPTSAREFLDFAKDITSARNRVWACEDMKWFSGVMHGGPSRWWLKDGKLEFRVEAEEFLEALEWTRKLYEAGVVHPDAVSDTGDSTARFTSGESLMQVTGNGAWYPTAAEQRGSNPDFRMNAFDYFAPDGGDPVLWRGNGADIWTFVNKNLPEERIKAALEVANYAAAPFGTVEQRRKRRVQIERRHDLGEIGELPGDRPLRQEGRCRVLMELLVAPSQPPQRAGIAPASARSRAWARPGLASSVTPGRSLCAAKSRPVSGWTRTTGWVASSTSWASCTPRYSAKSRLSNSTPSMPRFSTSWFDTASIQSSCPAPELKYSRRVPS